MDTSREWACDDSTSPARQAQRPDDDARSRSAGDDPCGPHDAPVAAREAALAIAIIDYQDGYTQTKGLGALLTDLGYPYTDLTATALGGTALNLSTFNVFIIGSFASQSATLNNVLYAGGAALRQFVSNGGTVIMLTQADQNRAAEDWLPAPALVGRGDFDYDLVYQVQPGHGLFTTPNVITNANLQGWRYGTATSWVTSWESINLFSHVGVLAGNSAASVTDAAIVEAGWGAGRVLFLSLAVDKARNLGNAQAATQAPRLMQNLLAYAGRVAGGTAPAIVEYDGAGGTYPNAMTGRVFNDLDNDGRYTPGEPGVAGVAVSDTIRLVRTDADGRYLLPAPAQNGVLLYIGIPSGYSKWATWYRHITAGSPPAEFDFALTAVDEGGPFDFVQVSDIHHANTTTLAALNDAIDQIAGLASPPHLIFATGDLINDGNDTAAHQAFADAAAAAPIPFFSVFGNHEYGGGGDGTVYYRKFLGPDYYALDYADCHFLVLNSVVPSALQDAWVAADLAGVSADRRIFVFQHYSPTAAEYAKFAAWGVEAVFSGHWHSQHTVQAGAVASYNSPPLIMGGIDCSPAGFKIVQVSAAGLSTRVRWLADGRRLKIVAPVAGQPVAHDSVEIVANAYETSAEQVSVEYAIRQSGVIAASGTMVRYGDWSWRALVHKEQLPPGAYDLEVNVTDDRQEVATAMSTFTVRDAALPVLQPIGAWRQFGGGPTRVGVTSAPVRPPLGLRWACQTGGTLDFSSPVVDGNDLYIGVKDRGDFDQNGVMSINVRDGRINWFARTPAAVSHSVAVGDELVYACSHGGVLHAIERSTGAIRWEHTLGSDTQRWLYGAPLLDGDAVYAGTLAWFGRYDALTGAPAWEKVYLDDWISSNASPAGDGVNLIVAGNWADYDVRSVNAASGAVNWQYQLAGLHGTPVIAGSRVLLSTYDARLFCLRLSDGLQLWGRVMAGWRSSTTPAVSGNTVVCGSTGAIQAFRLDNGTPLWRFNIGTSPLKMAAYDLSFAALAGSPTVVDDLVYVPCGDGRLYVLKLATGELVWSMDFGAPMLSAVCAVGNAVFVSSYDGHVYALAAESAYRTLRDIDGNGLMDLADLARLVDCMGGPAGGGSCSPSEFLNADLTHDGRVDMRDYADFQAAYGP